MFSTLFSVLSAYQQRFLCSGWRSPQPKGRRAFQPSLECLEDRCVPATLQVGASETYHTITSALQHAKPGDTVRIQPGTYQEAVDITTNNITLEGVNQSTVIIEPPAATSPPPPAASIKAAIAVNPGGSSLASNNYSLVQVNGATGVTIKDLTVGGPYTGGFSTITTNGTANSLGMHAGIFVSNGGSATITDNLVTNIRDNTPNTTNNDGFAILVGSESDVLNTAGTAVVEGNTINNYQSAGITIGGTGSSATIRNNTITGLGLTLGNQYLEQVGIAVQPGGAAKIHKNTVSNNVQTAAGTFAAGIYLDGALTPLGASGNTFRVTGNTVTGNNTGIYAFSNQGGTIANNQVSGNTDSGILLSSTKGSTVTGNTVTGNSSGLIAFSVQGGTIAFNHASDNTNDGIDLFSTSGVTLLANETNGNGGTGISLFSSTDNVVLLNTVKHNGAFGIFVDSASTGNLFLLNSMSGNGADDAFDTTTGSGTADTANTWIFNTGKTDSPSGLLRSLPLFVV